MLHMFQFSCICSAVIMSAFNIQKYSFLLLCCTLYNDHDMQIKCNDDIKAIFMPFTLSHSDPRTLQKVFFFQRMNEWMNGRELTDAF